MAVTLSIPQEGQLPAFLLTSSFLSKGRNRTYPEPLTLLLKGADLDYPE